MEESDPSPALNSSRRGIYARREGALPIAFVVAGIILGALSLGRSRAGEGDELPAGSAPPAIPARHFPDSAHAVIWRSWGLVEPARIARVLETDEETVRGTARELGLPPSRGDEGALRRRLYITLVRRYWHLLPYEQILELTGMTRDELAFALREDDFLFVKLGSLKPRAERVTWQSPGEATRARVRQIRELVERQFEDEVAEPGEARFGFVEKLSRVEESVPTREKPRAEETPGRRQTGSTAAGGPPRIIYSYFGAYGDALADRDADPYPDGLLERLAREGVNGVWLHVLLRQLAPGGEHFPEFGDGSRLRLERLQELVSRARRFGVGVWLYLNEPRAMPSSFFTPERLEAVAGVREGDWIALCTSAPAVTRWLSSATEHVFREAPGLAGVFTITASENLTSCASHSRRADCPRCRTRSDAEIIAGVNAAIASGVHRAAPDAKVLAWDWGWNGHRDATDVIARLPEDVWLLSVSEWAKPFERGGVRNTVGEYSLSVVGPGPRSVRHWKSARERGLSVAAKVQLNTTWEIASVPFLPALDLVAEHAANLAREGVDGLLLSWTVGGYPSPNLRVANRVLTEISRSGEPGGTAAVDIEAILDATARERYGDEAAAYARRAWTSFSEALGEYPYDGAVVYFGPQHVGPANLLALEPTHYQATMVGIPYDDIDRWRGPYPRETFASQFEMLAAKWAQGIETLEEAIARTPPELRSAAEGDLRVARAAGIHFRSVANQARFVIARDALAKLTAAGVDRDASTERRSALRDELRRRVEDEMRLARELFPIARDDSRIGFEASNHYFYVPLDLVEKVIACERLLEELGEREKGEKQR